MSASSEVHSLVVQDFQALVQAVRGIDISARLKVARTMPEGVSAHELDILEKIASANFDDAVEALAGSMCEFRRIAKFTAAMKRPVTSRLRTC